MARGLLGREHPCWIPHRRKQALRDADLVVLAGVPADFRMGYGRHIRSRAATISINRSQTDLTLNLRPTLPVHGDPGRFLLALGRVAGEAPDRIAPWVKRLRGVADERDAEIASQADEAMDAINPLALCRAIDQVMDDDAILVADGGDFVGTAANIVRPRGPLRWLDPGPFGTLGVGGGFAVGARVARPDSEVWVLYGDGSSAYSLAEIDTCVRLGLPIIAVIGNDAAWSQIARDQVEILGDPVGTVLRPTDYHVVAEGYGGRGLVLDDPAKMLDVLREAKEIARAGRPVVINAHIAITDFRKGSISV
jgi:acetolactate synthase-1/2/3 large subunit